MNLRVPLPPRDAVGSPVTPVLRAVLLADLADSTAFVQRFGDARAAAALQRLDLQIRDLLEFTGGRLIDKADGLLALFERPIQAVDFALRYQQALRQFSVDEGAPLAARVGIHVGELMTWSNSEQDVRAGAKPLEVEGLAKPVAARLMALALPGQILVSSMAQALAQRAQAELGERAERIRWMSHGRYRFKGVPAPVLVHEVGEVGASPLKQPPSGHKVWRELPLWRRPPVLAVELMLFLAVIGFYGWTLLRSPPALAFQQRDWVVVGDLNNFTGDIRLQDSIDTALRIELGQSRHVNLVSDMKVRDALKRMGRNSEATVDRAIGSEIALRSGARALLLPSVAEVGGKLRVSVEVVDPNTQTTVFAQSADGRGIDSALASLDEVAGQLRGALGESIASIEASDKPLAQATTSSLDALRAFSLGDRAYRESRDKDALALFEQALSLDPGFAMAKFGLARVRARNGEFVLARELGESALRGSERLSEREKLQLEAFLARFGTPAQTMNRYKLWAAMYPDSYAAYGGYALSALEDSAYEEGLAFLAPALSANNPSQGNAFFLQGALQLALNRYADARLSFQRAESLGVGGDKLEAAELHAAQRDFAAARQALGLQTKSGMAGHDIQLRLDDPLFLLDEGKLSQSLAAYAALQPEVDAASPGQGAALRGTRLLLDGYAGSAQPAHWRNYLQAQATRMHGDDPHDVGQAAFTLLAGGWMAARLGDAASAQHALELTREAVRSGPTNALLGMQAIVEAELALADGKPGQAIQRLLPRHDGRELYFSHAVLLRAYLALKDYPAALAQAQWLARQRGRAYAEWNSWGLLSAPNVLESNLAVLSEAEIHRELGNASMAAQRLRDFQRAWPDAERGIAAARIRRLQEQLRNSSR